ncbi:MAG: DUF2339 domain-containing protein [Myxococcota bacterium]
MPEDEAAEIAALRSTLNQLSQLLRTSDERLRRLEGGPAQAPASPPSQAAAPPASAPARPSAGSAVPKPRRPRALETWLRSFLTEGNPLNKLGALSLIFGAVIVFKYAVDNQWLGPTGRIGLGFLVGAGLFALGEVYARRGWQGFASGLVGAGNGVLFVAVYFGQQQYAIIPAGVAFGLYVLLTATVVTQSLRYDGPALAVWGLLGGYLTPVLASTGSGDYVFLSSYLLVLNSGVFAVAYHRNWQPLKWMAFALTVPYTALWVIDFLAHSHETRWLELHWLLPFLGVFFLYFAAIPTWRSLVKREPIDVFGQALTVMNGAVHFGLAAALLYEDHRAWLGVVSVLAAFVYVVISRQVVRQPTIDGRALRVFSGTAAAFLLLATPFLATGSAITLVWCAETVFLAWVCTQPRFGFLVLHVVAMLGIIALRLIGFDSLFRPMWVDTTRYYLPFTELRSYPPFLAALTFALVARFLRQVPDLRLPLGRIVAVALFIGVAALHGESTRLARLVFVPFASSDLQDLVRAGLLVGFASALWFGVLARSVRTPLPWLASFGFSALLLVFIGNVLIWPGRFGGAYLGWMHLAVLLMLPLVFLLFQLLRDAPERALAFNRQQLQAACLAAAVLVVMLLLRREVFAITHAPPIADLFSNTARQSAYNMLLSLCYALVAFGLYLNALRNQQRLRLRAAYALYLFTAFKVYLFDLEAQNQLYRAFSLLAFAALLFVSSYFANRRRASHA